MRKTIGVTLAAAAVLATSACGGSSSASDKASGTSTPKASTSTTAPASPASAGRPSVTDVSTSLQTPVSPAAGATAAPAKFSKKQADCAAKVLVASAISDEALSAIVQKDATFKETAADDAALNKVSTQLKACVA